MDEQREVYVVNEPLGAIVFVMDYVQVMTTNYAMNCYSLPILIAHDNRVEPLTPGWRDALCELIGSIVEQVEVLTDRVEIKLDGGALLVAPLIDEPESFAMAPLAGGNIRYLFTV